MRENGSGFRQFVQVCRGRFASVQVERGWNIKGGRGRGLGRRGDVREWGNREGGFQSWSLLPRLDPLKRSEKGVSALPYALLPPPNWCWMRVGRSQKAGEMDPIYIYIRREGARESHCRFLPFSFLATQLHSTQLKSIHVPQFSLQTGPVRNGWEELCVCFFYSQ